MRGCCRCLTSDFTKLDIIRRKVLQEKTTRHDILALIICGAIMKNTVLIVDDEVEAVEILGRLFEMQGYDVLSANDGVEACELLERCKPNIVLSDYMMPRLNGRQLCDQLKAQASTRTIPFILMSSMHQRLEDTPADAVLKKPIEVPQLLDMVQRLIEPVHSA